MHANFNYIHSRDMAIILFTISYQFIKYKTTYNFINILPFIGIHISCSSILYLQ